jgi:hypothetical protein
LTVDMLRMALGCPVLLLSTKGHIVCPLDQWSEGLAAVEVRMFLV